MVDPEKYPEVADYCISQYPDHSAVVIAVEAGDIVIVYLHPIASTFPKNSKVIYWNQWYSDIFEVFDVIAESVSNRLNNERRR